MRAVLGLFVLALLAHPARAETLTTTLSAHQVRITSTYTGAEIVLFGTIDRDAATVARGAGYDLVVTVSGPKRNFLVRERERAGFAWINRSQRRFVDMPSYIAVLSNRPLEEITNPILRQRLKVGIDPILMPLANALPPDSPELRFRDALKRLEKAAGRFVEDERGVSFLTPSLFRATIPLPATTPIGAYVVETVLFADGVPLARQTSDFEVVKTGFEQNIAGLAHEYAGLYGLLTAAMALAFGWLASVIFRRD